MTIFAYACIEPFLETPPTTESWGQPIDGLYVDQGYTGAQRPALQQLLQDCLKDPPDSLLLQRLGDLAGSLSGVMAQVESLEQQGITVIAQQPPYQTPSRADSTTLPGHRQQLMQLAAQIQAQHRSLRLRAGHAARRVQCHPPPGRAPYGYRRGRDRYTLDRTAAPVVKAFFEQFLLFGSIRKAVRHLGKTYGKQISASTGQRWLTHPAYRGDLLYKDGRTIQDTHTPIISREEAAQVDRLLRRNRRLPPKTASAPRSLAGLVQCQTCHTKLRVSRVSRPYQAQEYLYLRPIQCGQSASPCKAIAYDDVLTKTIQQVCQDLPKAISGLKSPPVAPFKQALTTQIHQKEAVLATIDTLVQQEILDTTTADLRAYTLRSEIATLKQQVSQLPPENLLQIVNTLSLPEFWQDLSEAERRVYLREFIQTIFLVRQEHGWHLDIRFVF